MELRQLQYAIQIAVERNFSRAAEKLHIAQPSLSQQLSKLEKEIGVLLFQRSTNSVELTHAGSLFVEKAQSILDKVEQLKKEMEDISQMKKGRLVVGSMPITGSTILPFVVPVFQAAYPEIEISLVEETSSQLETLTSNGQTDISLLSLPLREDSLYYETLLVEEIVLAVPPQHPLTGRKEPIDIKELQQESFIGLKKGQGFSKLTLDLCQQEGFTPKIVFESSNMETVQSLVAAGMGIAFVPILISKRSWSEPAPIHLALKGRPTRTLVIAYRKGRYISKAAEAFIDTMKQVMKDYR
ncbi:LysR family transcriptional regulator [Paenibacillus sp. GP183]|jgi:LysR family hydrogen peroxide-inducible transcriptional activator|uniref:LysR family transcriptional regulator n=1 Tax=Paenibacillus sp. GP183 TaxID=1882751 RepID=UPI000895DE63|nr:LysR family transcriptional regulator [Paenibacillus sp. GP183]SEB62609.1 DNA-binding transcriptional regulator, LysR family [Paenibacillus sp. GP183]